MKKVVIVGGGILIIVVVVAAYFLLSNLNSIVAGAIEKNGSEITETDVAVSGVDISLRDGRGSIAGLRVASPDGFDAGDAFSLGDITVDIDVGSVRKEPIVIDEVRIQAPVVNVEFRKDGKSNIDELRKRVQAYGGGGGEKRSGGNAKNIRIAKFVFEKGQVTVDASALGIDKRTIDLPEIHLSNVGGADGAPPDEIAQIILTAVAKQVGSEIAGSEVDRLIKDQLGESLTDKAKGLLNKLKD